jgi:hypothetical protein
MFRFYRPIFRCCPRINCNPIYNYLAVFPNGSIGFVYNFKACYNIKSTYLKNVQRWSVGPKHLVFVVFLNKLTGN